MIPEQLWQSSTFHPLSTSFDFHLLKLTDENNDKAYSLILRTMKKTTQIYQIGFLLGSTSFIHYKRNFLSPNGNRLSCLQIWRFFVSWTNNKDWEIF